MTSGKLVVGAAIIAPVGSNVRSFNANADLCTWSRQRPRYVQPESQLCQNFTVLRSSCSALYSDGGVGPPSPSLLSPRTTVCDSPSASAKSPHTPPWPSTLTCAVGDRA